MARRVGAIVFLAVGAYVAAMGIGIGARILGTLLDGPWLGLEPEILIPIGLLLVAVLLVWMGVRLWGPERHV
jgi:ABC-type branched-subunit amino acid transport system permease subunit